MDAGPLEHNLDDKVSKSVEDDGLETGKESHVPNAVHNRRSMWHDRQTGRVSPRSPGSFSVVW